MLELHADSHLDHNVPAEVVNFILDKYKDRDKFFLDTFELPTYLPPLTCALYGPHCGDQVITEDMVTYANRGERKYQSRLIDRPVYPTQTCTVIAGPYTDGHGKHHPMVLYTVYGGPPAPPEPGGFPENYPDSKKAEAVTFWAKHALAK